MKNRAVVGSFSHGGLRWWPGLGVLVTTALMVSPGCGDRRGVSATGGSPGAGGLGGFSAGGAPGTAGSSPDGNLLPVWQWQVGCPDGHEPQDPIDYGRCAIDQALAEAHATRATIVATLDDPNARDVRAAIEPLVGSRAESFAIAPIAGTTWIIGRDAVGAMYGALEIAERVRLNGPETVPPQTSFRATPSVPFRAANLFWTLPERDETEWWFLDESFWRDYLDLLAHARLDVLDLHATYEPVTTQFPSAFVYLANAPSFPNVGAPAAERDRNVRMMNRIVALAHQRGIRVALMTYAASSLTGADVQKGVTADPLVTAGGDDSNLKTYDREAAADVVTRIPGLDMLGFRIGETGKVATWYADTFVKGVRQTGSTIPLYTRTWLSGRADIDALSTVMGPGMVLEAKYNGEHWAAPYAIAGGVFTQWSSYSYQTYLNPPLPWSFVFQVRAAGTHRIFREASFERTRRSILSLSISPRVTGFSLEPPHAYSAQREFYHAKESDSFAAWTFARDDWMYLMWGRLGYDPNTPLSLFRAIAARETGTDGLWDAVQAASDIVPWIQTARTCGPDSRDFEPEMEVGGDVAQWANLKSGSDWCGAPTSFDTFAVANPDEAAADLMAGHATSRISPLDVAARVLEDVDQVQRALAAVDATTVRVHVLARDVARECRALADLGRHFAHKLRAATALAVFARSGATSWLDTARVETTAADDAWTQLATDTAYIKPFSERLRMLPLGYDPFHWSLEIPTLAADKDALDAVASSVAAKPPAVPARPLPDPDVWLTSQHPPGPGPVSLAISPLIPTTAVWTVTARFASPLPQNAHVRVLWKPFDSEQDWRATAAIAGSDGTYGASIMNTGAGGLFAVEVDSDSGAWRYPDPMVETPYLSLAP